MASIRKKRYKSGKIVWVIDYYEGKKHRSKTIGAVDKRTAEQVLHNFVVEKRKRQFGVNDIREITLKLFRDTYLVYSKAMKSYGTYDREKRVLRRFIESFGDINLKDITKNDLRNYQVNRLKKVNPVTTNLEFRHLKAIFNWAVDQEYLVVNPFKGIKPIKTAESDLPKFFEIDEIVEVRKAFKNDPMEKLIEFYLLTGARLTEPLNLKWDDIDFERKKLVIKGVNTKSKKHRIISFENDQALEKLLTIIPRIDSEYVFVQQISNTQYSSWWVSNRISRKLTKIGFPFASCHTFRHTYISHLIMNNVPIATVKEIVGHSSIQTTLRYAHLATAHKDEMASKRPY